MDLPLKAKNNGAKPNQAKIHNLPSKKGRLNKIPERILKEKGFVLLRIDLRPET